MKLNRIISAVLSAAVLICSFAGCSFSKNDAPDPLQLFSELKADSELTFNSKGSFSVNITSDSAAFSDDIGTANVTVYSGTINDNVLPDTDSADGIALNHSEYAYNVIVPDSVVRTSEKSVKITFTDKKFVTELPDSYVFVFDSKSSDSDKILFASSAVRYQSYSVVSDTTTILSDQKNIRINLTLDKGSFSDEISKDSVILSGSLSECKVNKVERMGDNSLAVMFSSGKNMRDGTGYISVSENALVDSAFDVCASVKVVTPNVVFDADSFEASDNYSRISISLSDCAFTDRVSAEMFSCDNPYIEISRFDRTSQNEGVIYLSLDMESAAEVVNQISSTEFTISDAAVSVNNPLSFEVKPKQPMIIADIVSLAEKDSEFEVTAKLEIFNGSFNILSKNSFVFGGDYSKAVISSLTAKDESAEVTFLIPRTSSAELARLSGTLAFKPGSVTSRWGETAAVEAFPVSYFAEYSSLHTGNLDYSNDDVLSAYRILSNYSASSGTADMADISAMMNCADDNSALIGYFTDIAENSKYMSAVYNKLVDVIESDRLAVTAQSRYYKECVRTFLENVNCLNSVDYEAVDAVIQMYELTEQISKTDDSQELDKLNNETEKLSEKITDAYSGKIRGYSHSNMLTAVIDEYSKNYGAVYAFDMLVDSMYNWSSQTVEIKNLFRYFVQSSILGSSIVSLYSIGSDTQRETGYTELSSIAKRLSELSDFIEITAVVNTDSNNSVYCNTLGRIVTLSPSDGVNTSYAAISSAEITQLENMLEDGVSLRDELSSVGFDIDSVRYLVFSDSTVTDSLSSSYSSEGNSAVKIYSFSSKTNVYDLLTLAAVPDFEYRNHSYRFIVNQKSDKPEFSISLKKKIGLYTLS